MIKFPMIHIQDKNAVFDPILLGSDKHHMLQRNQDGSLDFLNLQNHDMTGKFGDHYFAVDPDNEDLLPLVSFDTLMHEIEPLLNLNDKDARTFGKAVAEINNLLDQSETKENQRLSEIVGQNVNDYLKNKDLAKLKKAKKN